MTQALVEPDDAHSSVRPGTWVLCTLCLVVALASWLIIIPRRVYDPDEFEHIHAGLSVMRGQLPYRDFFEHHGPITYWLSALVCQLVGVNLSLLFRHRVVAAGLFLLTMAALWFIFTSLDRYARTLEHLPDETPASDDANRRSMSEKQSTRRLLCLLGFTAALLLSYPPFFDKVIEFRPDGLAMLLMTVVGWTLLKSITSTDRTWSRMGSITAAGLGVGLAMLCTPKVAPMAVGFAFGWLIDQIRSRRFRIVEVLAGAVATSVPIGICAAYFAARQSLSAFAEEVFILPVTWHTSEIQWLLFSTPLVWSAGHLTLALVPCAIALGRTSRRFEPVSSVAFMLMCGPLLQLGFAFAMKTAFLQYYQPLWPILIGVSLWYFDHITRRLGNSSHLATCVVLTGIIALIIHLLSTRWALVELLQEKTFADLRENPMFMFHFQQAAIDVVALVLSLTLLMLARFRRSLIYWGIAALMLSGAGRVTLRHLAGWDNAGQERDLKQLVEALGPPQPQLTFVDGFTGLTFLYHHADNYFWLNQYSIGLFAGQRGTETLLASRVIQANPAVIVVDNNLSALLKRQARLLEFVSVNYQPLDIQLSSNHARVFIRNDVILKQPPGRERQ